MAIDIPPPPNTAEPGSRIWLDWFNRLRNTLSSTAGLAWALIDKTGSRLDDLASREHSQLTSISGTGVNHIDNTEAAKLTAIKAATTIAGYGITDGVTLTGAQAVSNKTITSSTLDSSVVGGTTPAIGSFSRVKSDPAGAIRQINAAGTADHTKNWLYGYTRWFDIPTAVDPNTGFAAANTLLFADAADGSTLADQVNGLLVLHNVQGNSNVGSDSTRQALQSRIQITGQVGGTDYMAFVSQLGTGWATATQGGTGTGGDPDNFRGGLFGGNDNVWLASGATYYRGLTGREIDVHMTAGASSYFRAGLMVVDPAASAVQGTADDTAIAITGGTGSVGWKTGLQFGMTWGDVTFTDALIKIQSRVWPTPVAFSSVPYGIDFTSGVFSTAAIATPGFEVDPDGNITGESLSLTTPIAASEVSNTPAGSIAATDVQAAINELDTEKAPLSHDHTAADGSGPLTDDEHDSNIIITKTSGKGIKIDLDSPAFGWRDIIGNTFPKTTGAGTPARAAYAGGNIGEFAFVANDICDFGFHLPHDYAPGTDIYIHVHWSHTGTTISGDVVFDLYHSYAKGHNQENFPAEKNVTITYATTDITTTPQYRHRIDEVIVSGSSATATLMDRDLLEPDGFLMVTLKLTTLPTIGGGGKLFIHNVDVHYQSTNLATKNREPGFYS